MKLDNALQKLTGTFQVYIILDTTVAMRRSQESEHLEESTETNMGCEREDLWTISVKDMQIATMAFTVTLLGSVSLLRKKEKLALKMKSESEAMAALGNVSSTFHSKLMNKSFLNLTGRCLVSLVTRKCAKVDGIIGQLADDFLESSLCKKGRFDQQTLTAQLQLKIYLLSANADSQ
mmetsp:Transcript_9264/g.8918  ORF Transcript_9264/g.8918 Transcript_9264/m.8918 type:complete len:177 (+) Transcript_9264:209-739(+)